MGFGIWDGMGWDGMGWDLIWAASIAGGARCSASVS